MTSQFASPDLYASGLHQRHPAAVDTTIIKDSFPSKDNLTLSSDNRKSSTGEVFSNKNEDYTVERPSAANPTAVFEEQTFIDQLKASDNPVLRHTDNSADIDVNPTKTTTVTTVGDEPVSTHVLSNYEPSQLQAMRDEQQAFRELSQSGGRFSVPMEQNKSELQLDSGIAQEASYVPAADEPSEVHFVESAEEVVPRSRDVSSQSQGNRQVVDRQPSFVELPEYSHSRREQSELKPAVPRKVESIDVNRPVRIDSRQTAIPTQLDFSRYQEKIPEEYRWALIPAAVLTGLLLLSGLWSGVSHLMHREHHSKAVDNYHSYYHPTGLNEHGGGVMMSHRQQPVTYYQPQEHMHHYRTRAAEWQHPSHYQRPQVHRESAFEQRVNSLQQTTKDLYRSASERAGQAVDSVKAGAEATVDQAKNTAQQAKDKVVEGVENLQGKLQTATTPAAVSHDHGDMHQSLAEDAVALSSHERLIILQRFSEIQRMAEAIIYDIHDLQAKMEVHQTRRF